MRNTGRLKLGFYPLPVDEARRLRGLLHAEQPFAAIDPCVGMGEAFNLLTEGLPCERHGVELDADRAQAAREAGISTTHGNLFNAHARVETFSLLYLNPPYDSEIGSSQNDRMELLFLEHTFRWLVPGGVLVFVVPDRRLPVCFQLLAAHFVDVRIFELTDPESVRFGQVVLTGVRKSLRGEAMEANRRLIQRRFYNEKLLTLSSEQEPYAIPPTPPAQVADRGLPVDEIEDMLPQSAAWKQIACYLVPKEEMASGRPITPLHAGHVGLLCTAGLLNGVFGKGDDRHIARWRSVKQTTIVSEEEDGDGAKVTRKQERFSNELSLIYEDGRQLILNETPRFEIEQEKTDAERTSAVGQA